MGELQVFGKTIYYNEESPDRRPKGTILFVHGAGGYSGKWRSQLPAMASLGWRAIAVDLPGHGYSEGPNCGDLAEYATFLNEFAQRAELKNLVLCGHSMGGGIAQLFAFAFPSVLRGLVLIGTGAKLRVHPDILAIFEKNAVTFDFLKAAFSGQVSPEHVQEEMDEQSYTDWRVRFLDFKACDQFSAAEEVSRIKVPTLIIVGREDRLTPVKHSQFLAEKIEGARQVVVEGSGHYVMKEHPRETNEALGEFLNSLSPRTD